MNVLVSRWWRVPLAVVVTAAAMLAIVYGVAADSGSGDDGSHGRGRGASIERTESAVAFRNDMRKLWEDHITWTRLFIVSFAADLPDLGPTTDRLLRNQTDIGDAVKPYYGDAAGDQLTELLRQHILTAADLLAAAKSGDTAAFDAVSPDLVRQRKRHRGSPAQRQPGQLVAGRAAGDDACSPGPYARGGGSEAAGRFRRGYRRLRAGARGDPPDGGHAEPGDHPPVPEAVQVGCQARLRASTCGAIDSARGGSPERSGQAARR